MQNRIPDTSGVGRQIPLYDGLAQAGGFQVFNMPQFNGKFIVVGAKGNPQFREAKAFNAVFNAPRAGHSVKPDEFYALLRRVAPEPRLDLFSRREIEGFEGWVNE